MAGISLRLAALAASLLREAKGRAATRVVPTCAPFVCWASRGRRFLALLGMTGYAENDMRGVWDEVEDCAPILRI